jgi:flagellar biosynthesis GTPase FlhF
MLEGANISPPIGSKLRKLYTGLQQTKFEKDLIAERGWGVMQDGRVHLGPMYGVTGKILEAGTNLPMDRLVNKIENVSQAMNSQNQAWQRVAVGLGFTPYSVGIEESKGDLDIRAKAKANRKEEGKIKSKATREATKEAKEEAYEALPQAKKDSISLSEYLLKEKKARDKFIEKAVEEANMTPDELALKKYQEKEKRKANKGKYKENKIRNQRIRDSINLDVFLKKNAK